MRMSRVNLWREPGAAGPIARRTVQAGAPVFAAVAAGGEQDAGRNREAERVCPHPPPHRGRPPRGLSPEGTEPRGDRGD